MKKQWRGIASRGGFKRKFIELIGFVELIEFNETSLKNTATKQLGIFSNRRRCRAIASATADPDLDKCFLSVLPGPPW